MPSINAQVPAQVILCAIKAAPNSSLFWCYCFINGARGASRDAVLSILVQNHAVLQHGFSVPGVVFKTSTLALQKCSPKHLCSTYPSLPLHLPWHFAYLSTHKASREVERAERDIAPENWLLSSNAIPQLLVLVRDLQGQKRKRQKTHSLRRCSLCCDGPNT